MISSPYTNSWTALQVGQTHSVAFQSEPKKGIETAFTRMTANRAAISSSRANIFFLCLLGLASLGMKEVESYLDGIDCQN
jgi:hypothetical protein